MIHIHVPFEVQPKQGDRSRVISARDGRQFVHHYQPDKVTRNAKALALMLAPHRPERPYRGAIELRLTFNYPHLKSASKKKREHRTPKSTKPDWDNLAKQVCDVLQRCGFYLNDSQIARAVVEKCWDDKAPAGLHLAIEEQNGGA